MEDIQVIPSSAKLQELYQILLKNLLVKQGQQSNDTPTGQKNDDEKRAMIKELDYQIKKEKQKHELLQMQQNLSSVMFAKSANINPSHQWHDEMYSYNQAWNGGYSDTRLFFDIVQETDSLSFSTRYKGKCLRISVHQDQITKEYSVDSSMAINGLTKKAVDYLAGGKTATEFVKDVVHKGLEWLS